MQEIELTPTRQEVVKIAGETDRIANERIDWKAICEQNDPQEGFSPTVLADAPTADPYRRKLDLWAGFSVSHPAPRRGLQRAASNYDQIPILDHAKQVLITSSVVLVGSLAIIWAAAYFAQKAGLPW